MQQERHVRRKPFQKLLPFLAGAVTMGAVLVACDRPATRADAGAADDAAAHAQAPVVAAAAPQAQEPAPQQAVPAQQQPAPASQQPAPAPSAAPLPPADALADTAITSRIKTEILQDPAMRGTDVSVNTDRGVVVLAGLVKNPEQTAVASAHADHQDGVMRVDNRLSIAQQ